MYLSESRVDKGFFPYKPGSQCGMIHNDHLGTPQKMTDSTGTAVWAADYKPFGEATIDQTVTTITNNLRFPGQYYDAETGLIQNWWRDYNFTLGRYVEADRIGIRQGGNHLYSYAKLNPLLYIDKQGTIPNFGGGGFVVAGIVAGGFSFDFEECCKGTTKYHRTLIRIMYGLGLGVEVVSGGPSNGIQIFGPSDECQDYSFDRPERISCLSASYYLGIDACQNDGNRGLRPDSMSANIGVGAAAYTVWVRTYVWKEDSVGCCSKK